MWLKVTNIIRKYWPVNVKVIILYMVNTRTSTVNADDANDDYNEGRREGRALPVVGWRMVKWSSILSERNCLLS